MQNDWIKMRTDLYRDPKVCIMADELFADGSDLARYVNQMNQCDMAVTRNVMRNAVVGGLLSVWGVLRHRGTRNGDDLVCPTVSVYVLDDIADMQGFGNAMLSVGWVVDSHDGLVFPRFFAEYNVDPDKKTKSVDAIRQQRFRDKKKAESNALRNAIVNVTDSVTVTPREEKRREEKKEGLKPFALPDWIPAEAWNGYVDMRRKIKKPMTDRALELKVIELGKFRDAGHDLAAILNKSAANSWTDIYPPKEERGGAAKPASAVAAHLRGAI